MTKYIASSFEHIAFWRKYLENSIAYGLPQTAIPEKAKKVFLSYCDSANYTLPVLMFGIGHFWRKPG